MSAPEPPVLPDLNSGHRNFITTVQDHGGIALTICTLMATWVILCLGVRAYMRATVSGPFGLDDIVCSVATIFGVLQVVVSSVAISFGFGKALDLLTDSEIVKASKAVYAAQLLYIITNTLTKCTVALLLARIVIARSRIYACYAVLVLTCVWGLVAFLVQAIQCTGSPPWQIVGEQCNNFLLSWQVLTAFNVLIEALLFALPVWLIWNLQTRISRKMKVVAVFSLRLPVIVVAILRVHYIGRTLRSDEPLLEGVVAFVCLQVEMHWGLISATIPTLKPFVNAFNTGWGTYDSQGLSGYGNGSGGSYALQSIGAKSNRSGRSGGPGSTALAGTQDSSIDRDALDEIALSWGKNITHVTSDRVSAESDDSKKMIIRQTQTCEVHLESIADRTHCRSTSRGRDSIEYVQPDPASLSR